MTSWFLPPASTFANDIDNLILMIAIIVGFWFVVAEVVLFGLIFRYRVRDGVRAGYVAGEDKREKRWVSYPHYAVLVFDVIIIIWALQVWNTVKVMTPPADEEVRIIAQQWAWTFVQPGPDGQLDTPDDIRTVDDLHVLRDRVYHFELHSRDVIHSFSVPAFRLKQDAVPGRVIRGWFEPTLEGTFDIQCTEICGMGHALMPGRLHVDSPEDFVAWMASAAGTAAAGPASSSSSSGMPDGGHDHSTDTGGAQ